MARYLYYLMGQNNNNFMKFETACLRDHACTSLTMVLQDNLYFTDYNLDFYTSLKLFLSCPNIIIINRYTSTKFNTVFIRHILDMHRTSRVGDARRMGIVL